MSTLKKQLVTGNPVRFGFKLWFMLFWRLLIYAKPYYENKQEPPLKRKADLPKKEEVLTLFQMEKYYLLLSMTTDQL